MLSHAISRHPKTPGPASVRGRVTATVLFSFLIPLGVVALLVLYVVSRTPSATGPAYSEKAIAERLKKVGSSELRASDRVMKTGEQVFQESCKGCHAEGALGAPKLGDAAAWAPRIKGGMTALLQSALKGKGNMGPQGGGSFDDFEIARAVVYMANRSGGKLADPVKLDAPKK